MTELENKDFKTMIMRNRRLNKPKTNRIVKKYNM